MSKVEKVEVVFDYLVSKTAIPEIDEMGAHKRVTLQEIMDQRRADGQTIHAGPVVARPGVWAIWYLPAETDEEVLNRRVGRFLGWRLPDNFNPDNGIKFTPPEDDKFRASRWPVGTNLFDFDQAKAMLRHVLAGD